MEFQKRLERAIERGRQRGDDASRAKAKKALSEKELRQLHSGYRIDLSDHIEECLRQLADEFPGFRFETIVGEEGWGGSIRRDDVWMKDGQRENLFSRLVMLIRPFGNYHVLELTAKGTIRNKEIFNRPHFQRLAEADTTTFTDMIDLWILEYAEQYAAGD